jgi:dTDP-4-amino-4,6-dideoxygalactose transaminase
VGTLGDAALFSFQVLKPLNTCGGGAAYTADAALAARIAALAGDEPWPAPGAVRRRLRLARLERALVRPEVFSATLYPILWSASWFGIRPDVYLWEKVRPLGPPLPRHYHERYSNTQAALGLAGLDELDGWVRATRRNATVLRAALSELPGVTLPPAPADRLHVYYQFCAYVPDRDAAVRACLRRGLDVESHHMDVCPDLAIFSGMPTAGAEGARRTAQALQLPVHAALSVDELGRVASRAHSALTGRQRPAAQPSEEAAS